jgi:hypothetical protein
VISTVIKTGVVAELEGKYWGVVYEGGGHGDPTHYGWTDITRACIGNPKYCTKPTSFTYEHSSYYAVLARAKLVTVKKTTHYEVEA